MFKKLIYIFLAIINFAEFANSKPQIYCGISCERNIIKNQIDLGENNYWGRTIKDYYNQNLQDFYNSNPTLDGGAGSAFLLGTPESYFDVLLQNSESNLLNENINFFKPEITIGAYLFRKNNIMICSELFFGYQLCDSSFQKEISLFKGDVPEEVKTSYPNVPDKYSTTKTLTQQIFYSGEIDLLENINVKNQLSFGMNIRLGTIVKDRAYIYSLVGAQIDNVKIYVNDEKISTSQIEIYYCKDSNMPTDKSEWEKNTFDDGDGLKNSLLKYDELKNRYSFLIGGGCELFITKKISLRLQCTYSFFTDVKINSNDGGQANLKLSSNGPQFSSGVFFRF